MYMDKIENKTVKDIFQELTSGKTIYGIKDSNMNIILRNPNRWLDIIIAIVVLILGLGIIQVLNQSEKVVGIFLSFLLVYS